jgi:signal transduction histidine kinase
VPSLFVIRGNDQGARFELDESAATLGRESSNTFQLRDNEVSRHHAEVRWQDGGFVIVDLNSSNGTCVNGRRISQQRLASGDQVLLGRTLMLYTGPMESPDSGLNTSVDIAATHFADDRSHIIHSLPQAEGSRLFQVPTESSRSSWLARTQGTLQMVYNTALAISHTLDIDQLLNRILELIFQSIEADRGCIMLLHPESKQLEPKARRTRQGIRDERISISKTILDYVLQQNEGVLTSDARQDQRWNSAASIVQAGIREAICVPMQGRYDVVGVIYLDTSTSPQEAVLKGGAAKFNEDHLKLLIAVAHQAALAVEDTRYYSAMVQAERLAAIGQAVATLSHHIKNILQGIRGGSYLIEMGLSDHDETVVSKGWKIVEKNQQKISALVMDMLTFSKEREPDLQPANINEVVADVIELSQTRAADLEVQLVCEPAAVMPRLIFDPEGLHRAILNVVTNAVDAACEVERPALVTIKTEFAPLEGKVRVIVDDNGTGIPPDHMPTLFNPFSSTKKGRGTGLGLPVSQKILTEHGGQILVQSTLGEGSHFVLELPAILADSSRNTLICPQTPET